MVNSVSVELMLNQNSNLFLRLFPGFVPCVFAPSPHPPDGGTGAVGAAGGMGDADNDSSLVGGCSLLQQQPVA